MNNLHANLQDQQLKVGIIGAGLAGCNIALLLAQLGFQVFLFEKREDPRISSIVKSESVSSAFGNSTSAIKRSINLALSYRGMLSLKEIGVLDEIMKDAIPMPGRVIHGLDGSIRKQAYGKDGEAIYSVGRQSLNLMLLNALSNDKLTVTTFFNYSLVDICNQLRKCTFINLLDNSKVEFTFDLVIGSDGAYSATRDVMLRRGRLNFSRKYIAHGYKELCIPPNSEGEYALPDYKGLHIWPRGKFMLIALPNPDKSFTATLFAPYKGKDGFDSINSNDKAEVIEYFQNYFPDVAPLIPDLADDFRFNLVGSLLTIRVNPWNIGRAVLIGDAAHAVVPFYGQGMNAAFEDGYILYKMIKANMDKNCLNIEKVIEEFSNYRQPAADALADMCLEHYDDMASNTASYFYLLKKQMNIWIEKFTSEYFLPIYSMVAFTNIPYHEARKREKIQDMIMNRILLTISTATIVGVGVGFLSIMKGEREL